MSQPDWDRFPDPFEEWKTVEEFAAEQGQYSYAE
jgi:hypothetical protein